MWRFVAVIISGARVKNFGAYIPSVEHKPIMGAWGRATSGLQRQSPGQGLGAKLVDALHKSSASSAKICYFHVSALCQVVQKH